MKYPLAIGIGSMVKGHTFLIFLLPISDDIFPEAYESSLWETEHG